METAKQVVSIIFGLLVAYFLPGLFVVIAIALVFPPIGVQLLAISNSTAPTGLSVFLFLTAILAGMQLNIIRWAIYGEVFCRSIRLTDDEHAKLGDPKRIEPHKNVIDQVFRYHQFSGAQSIAFPFFCFALFTYYQADFSTTREWIWLGVCLVVEGLTIWSAVAGWKKYVGRARALSAQTFA